jgi:hypothetical protein
LIVRRLWARLRLFQRPAAALVPLEATLDPEPPRRPVQIRPPQPQQLALAHARHDGQRVERFERIARRGGQETLGLGVVERLYRVALRAWGAHGIGRVAGDEAPQQSLAERAVEHRVDELDRPRREAVLQLRPVQAAEMLWGELRERQLAERRQDVVADQLLVAQEGAGAQPVAGGVGQPALEELRHGLPIVRDGEPLLLGGQSLHELRVHVLAGLAVVVLAAPVRQREPRRPPTIRALVDRALAVRGLALVLPGCHVVSLLTSRL